MDYIMNIKPVNKPGSHRQGTICGLSAAQIQEVLGFSANVKDDPYKVRYSWGFTVDGVQCGIWDYKGSHYFNSFSFYGPKEIMVSLFGTDYIKA